MGRHQEELAAKDKEISRLTKALRVHSSRNALLNTRLFETIDALDQANAFHQRELEAEIHARELTSHKMERYIEIMRATEAERDEMRDTIQILLEKVENSHRSFKRWPITRMVVSSLVDPVVPIEPPSSQSHTDYAPAILKALVAQRDLECHAHTRTRDAALRRIRTLEALAARREAQLEELLGEPIDRTISVPWEDDSETLQLLDLAKRRNREIENDLMKLVERLRVQETTPQDEVSIHVLQPPEESNPPQIQALDAEIASLGSQIDAFRAQRQVLWDVIHEGDRTITPIPNSNTIPSPNVILNPTPNLLLSPDPRAELQASQERQRALEEENAQLRRMIEALELPVFDTGIHTPSLLTDEEDVTSSRDGNSDGDGEMEMELATPLVLPILTLSRDENVDIRVGGNTMDDIGGGDFGLDFRT